MDNQPHNHRELADALRRAMTKNKDSFTYKDLEADIQVSDQYLNLFHHDKRDVCIVIMNRLANRFGVSYELRNFTGRDELADADGIYELRDLLRTKLRNASSIRAIARAATEIAIQEGFTESKISHEWLRQFIQGVEPCFVKMHGLAQHFGIKYIIRNYQEPEQHRVA